MDTINDDSFKHDLSTKEIIGFGHEPTHQANLQKGGSECPKPALQSMRQTVGNQMRQNWQASYLRQLNQEPRMGPYMSNSMTLNMLMAKGALHEVVNSKKLLTNSHSVSAKGSARLRRVQSGIIRQKHQDLYKKRGTQTPFEASAGGSIHVE